MKKLSLALLLLIPMGLAAQQNEINKLIEKYQDREGYVCMNLDSESLGAMMTMAANVEGESEVAEARESIKDVKSLQMIVTENAAEEFKEDVETLLAESDFESVISVNEEETSVRILMPKDRDERDDDHQEMLLAVNEGSTYVLMWIQGKVDPGEMMKNINI